MENLRLGMNACRSILLELNKLGSLQELYSKANPERTELSCRFFGYAGNVFGVKFASGSYF